MSETSLNRTQTIERPAEAGINPSDMVHVSAYCCGDVHDLALCGATLKDEDAADWEPVDCIVCVEIDEQGAVCPRCGRWG